MDAKRKVVIDAGHGGDYDPGAVFEGRREKDDNLRLALAVGEILERNGVDVFYTRVTDVYDSPLEKARMANRSGADLFVSLHRNAALEPGRGSGTMTLVYGEEGIAEDLAESINDELKKTGFKDLGIFERPDLIVLRRTMMPAVLVEAGFIDNPEDNARFDREFEAVAQAIADGILNTLREEGEARSYYMVQTGVYRARSLAEQQLDELEVMDHAVELERELRSMGFPTVLTYREEER